MQHSPFIHSRPNADVAIIMIHGILGTPRHFDWLIPAVPEECHISSILLPGHGGSVQDFSRSNMSQWKEAVEHAIASVEKPGRKIILVGHSLGSLLALNAAIRHESICGMLLLNVPFSPQVRFRLIGRSLRAIMGRSNLDDPKEAQYLRSCGTAIEPGFWKYLSWIPNYLSLLKLCKTSRPIPKALTIPCCAYLGGADDLVHPRSAKWLQGCHSINVRFFPHGSHFGYSQPEQEQITNDLKQLLSDLTEKNQARLGNSP